MFSLVSIIDDKRIEEMTDYAGTIDDVWRYAIQNVIPSRISLSDIETIDNCDLS